MIIITINDYHEDDDQRHLAMRIIIVVTKIAGLPQPSSHFRIIITFRIEASSLSSPPPSIIIIIITFRIVAKFEVRGAKVSISQGPETRGQPEEKMSDNKLF